MENVNIKTLHGHLFTCNKCSKIHFEFNQIAIDFSSVKILHDFYKYLNSIDSNTFEQLNVRTLYTRKIHIPFPKTSIKMVLSKIDLKELRILTNSFLTEYAAAEKETNMLKKLIIINEKQLN